MMSEEMKLLMALCDAMGFAVEVETDYNERKEKRDAAMLHNRGVGYPETGRGLRIKPGSVCAMLDIDEDGMYTSYLTKPITSYKLTPLACK
jgi:hypothetical protein